MDANLCRCGSYTHVVAAIEEAAAAMRGAAR
jgi:aerobic-type carbon monoxide dehydrogenase small subunit (CoxS/CutS family)